MISTFVGFACGVSIKTFANAMLRQRLLWRPWNTLACGTIGAYVGYNYFQWELHLLNVVNAKRIERGIQPIERKSAFGGLIYSADDSKPFRPSGTR